MWNNVYDCVVSNAQRFGGRIIYDDTIQSVSFNKVVNIAKSVGTAVHKYCGAEKGVMVVSGRHIYTPCAFLGVAFAGCYYVPVDAGMPIERLKNISNVANVACVIADRENASVASELCPDKKLFILEELIDAQSDDNILKQAQKSITPESPLYVIFTSGSTGVPKGVVTTALSVFCYIDAVCKVLEVKEEDVFGGQAPLDYIAAIRDIYIPLVTGAKTVIIPKNRFAMPGELINTLNEHKVSIICWSVAGVELISKLGGFEVDIPRYLRKVMFSGSVMHCKQLMKWQAVLPEVSYINQYGPTEATASCTYYVVDGPVNEDTVLPIGVPYDNYKVFLLNADGSATAKGELGEICVSGPCVTLGYYNDVERTNAVFVQNPLNKAYREIIYKTGDFGVMREDGMLEYHGRMDRQIKHMGHRIELGEIELAAAQIDGVEECVALYHKENEKLHLFYCGTATAKDISGSFRQRLPAFMVPRKIVLLEEMPRLQNQKIDMKALEALM